VAATDRTPLTAYEEQPREQRQEEVLRIESEEAQEVLEAVVLSGEAVERLVEIEVDRASVASGRAAARA